MKDDHIMGYLTDPEVREIVERLRKLMGEE